MNRSTSDKCPRCEHALKLHDSRKGCRCAFTERDPIKGRIVLVCGCRYEAVAAKPLVMVAGGAA